MGANDAERTSRHTALHQLTEWAIMDGTQQHDKVRCLQALLDSEKFTAVNQKCSMGEVALYCALRPMRCDPEVIRAIIAHPSTDLNIVTNGDTFLHQAIQNLNGPPALEICQMLLTEDRFTLRDAQNRDGKTAADLVRARGYVDVADVIDAAAGA